MNNVPSARGTLRDIGALSLATFNLTLHRTREFSFLALLALMSSLLSAYLMMTGASMVLEEEFSTVWNGISGLWKNIESEEPRLWLQEYRTEFGSIEWDFVSWGVPMLLGGTVIYLASVLIHGSAIARICMADFQGFHCSVLESLRWGIGRISRLTALFIRILATSIATIMMPMTAIALGIFISEVFVPISVVLFAIAGLAVLAMASAVILMPGILIIAFVAVAVGPDEFTLRSTVRFIRGRFWATLGRVYLIAVVAVSIGTIAELLASTVMQDMWLAAYLLSGAIELAGFTMCTAAACVVYYDAGGKIA